MVNRLIHAPVSYVIIVGCWLAYAALSLLAVPANNRFHLSFSQLSVLRLTIILPLLIIWLIALNGINMFKRYSQLISKGQEAKGITYILMGLKWSLAYLVALSLLGAVMPYVTNTPWLMPMIFLRNHLPVIISVIGFGLLFWGSYALLKGTSLSVWTTGIRWLMAGYCLFAAIFIWIFLSDQRTVDSSGLPLYTLNRDILLFTLVLPYLLSWFGGILTAFNVIKYSRGVKGIIYRKALRDLALGIVLVVGFSVTLQVLTISATFLANAGLGATLLLVYILILLYGLGFWFVKRGAGKLARIEVIDQETNT